MSAETYPTDSNLILYRLQSYPHCERVVRKLDDLDLEYHSRYVTAPHSERNVIKRISGSRTVPVLVDRAAGLTMSESVNINEYLEATYGESDE